MDDVDEDELMLAMSTELSRPAHPPLRRQTRSLTSLQDAQARQLPFLSDPNQHSKDAKAHLTALDPKPIKIQDHSLEHQDKDSADGLWASRVTVTEPSIIKGNQGKTLQAVSGYVVWLCTVETFEGRILKTRKRYSEFFTLRQNLCTAFPRHEKMIPALPPKSVVSKFRPAFLEKRRRGLELFLSTVLLMPDLGASPIVKKWWFV